MASGEIKLNGLELDSDIIASAMINIERLSISEVTELDSLKVFKKMTEQETHEDLNDVPHQIFVNAFIRVESLNLTHCVLTEIQVKCFF